MQPGAAATLADAGTIKLEGNGDTLSALGSLMDTFDPAFAIVTP